MYHKLDYPATEKTTIIYSQSQSADTDDLDPTTSADWREPTNSGANNYPLLTRSYPLAALATGYSSVDNQQLAIVDCLLTITRRQRAIIGHQSSMVNEQRAIITLRNATLIINYNLSLS
ncbi:hypothetical protein [Ensifer canadensis]|uniref:hypothetical protein n=1 Tax=Ensifer canadensis TaxID=555315 RepID=UPI0035E3BDCD